MKAVMSLYEGATIKVRNCPAMFDEFSLKLEVYQGSVITTFVHCSDGCGDGGCKKRSVT